MPSASCSDGFSGMREVMGVLPGRGWDGRGPPRGETALGSRAGLAAVDGGAAAGRGRLDGGLEGLQGPLHLVLRVGEDLRHRVAEHAGRRVVLQADLDTGGAAVVVEADSPGVLHVETAAVLRG